MLRRYMAEFVGTFVIVFAPVALAAAGGIGGLTAAAWVSGLSVLAMIYALGHISAAHFNPAVTLGFAVAKRFPVALRAAILGGSTPGRHRGGPEWWRCSLGAVMALIFRLPVPVIRADGLEALLTFFLMLVIIAVATDKRGRQLRAWSGDWTDRGLRRDDRGPGFRRLDESRAVAWANPLCRPAALSVYWLYVVGPGFGAGTAALLYERMRGGEHHAQGAPNDLYDALQAINAAAHASP